MIESDKEQRGTDLLTYWDVVWRRKWLVLAVVAVASVFSFYKASRIPPVYEAQAKLMVQSGNEADLFGSQPFYFWQPSQIQNHCQILQSRSLAESVAAEMKPELKARILALRPGIDLAGFVQGSFLVRPMTDADIIVISGRGEKPDIATGLANAVAETYQIYNQVQRRQEIAAVLDFVEVQQRIVGDRLKQGEDRLQQFKEANKIVSIDDEVSSMASQLTNFQTMREQNKGDIEVSQKRLGYLNDQLEKAQTGLSQKLSGASSPVMSSLKSTFDRLEVDRTNLLLQGIGENTPKVRALDSQIKDYRDKMKSELVGLISQAGSVDVMGGLQGILESVFTLKLDLEGFQARAKYLDSRAQEFDKELAQLPAQQRTFVELTRNVEADQKIYALLSEKTEQARITEAGRLSNIRIVDLAQGAHSLKARRRTSLVTGFFLGIFLGVGLSFLLEYLDTSIKDRHDFERISGLPVLATIPDLRAKRRWRFLRKEEPLVTHLLTHTDPKASGSEMFRMLRTNLEYASVDTPVHLLLVTSPGPQEGKSTVAVNLAVALAQAGAKTLIIDTDLRRPELHEVFGTDKKPGFTDLVLAGKETNGVIRKTAVENLSFLPCGTIPPSPADFLDSKAVNSALARFVQAFRYVIIDGAPALAVADTPILASKVDGVVLVVRIGKTAKTALRDVIKILTGAGVKIIGAVLNGIRLTGRRYSYYYYYYHYPEKK